MRIRRVATLLGGILSGAFCQSLETNVSVGGNVIKLRVGASSATWLISASSSASTDNVTIGDATKIHSDNKGYN
eukprot:6258725-Heterocapsa_arctica.AAC.1